MNDERCQDCGRTNVVWFTDNALWNLVVGGPDAPDDPGGILCPTCFIERAEKHGIKPTAWKLGPEAIGGDPPVTDQGAEARKGGGLMDAETAVKAIYRPLAVGQGKDGSTWAGTDAWLVRDFAAKHPDHLIIDGLTNAVYDVPVEQVRHGIYKVIANTFYGVLRPYLRPDGITVWLNEANVRAVEELLAEEAEDGSPIPAEMTTFQGEKRTSPIAFFRGPDLVALVMPVRMMNDHLTDGAGRVLESAGGNDG